MKIYNSLTSDIENEFFYKKSENEIQKNYVLLNNNEILDTNLMEEISECYFSENNSTKDWFIEDQLFSLGTSIANLSTNVNKQSDDEQKKSENLLETKTSEVYYCEYCSFYSLSSGGLMNHKRIHFFRDYDKNQIIKIGNEKVKCIICNSIFKNVMYFRRHYQKQHVQQIQYNCQQCNNFYFNKKSLCQHINNKHKSPKTYECPYCHKLYINKNSFFRHAKIKHDVNQDKFNSLNSVLFQEQHQFPNLFSSMQYEKINIESDILNSIPNTFKAPFELMKFVKKIQNDKKFYCTICYKFSHKYKNCTRNHVESKHFPKTFIYTCDNCKMSFFSKNSLSMHRSRKHKK